MANWVYTVGQVSGDTNLIKQMLEKVGQPIADGHTTYSNPVFSFRNIIPVPQEILEDYHGSNEVSNALNNPNHWYSWNIANWDTKWDVAVDDEQHPSTSIEFVDYVPVAEGESIVIIRFETPWSPPEKIYYALAEQYPNLEWDWDYEEETGWGGRIVFKQGSRVDESSYDYDVPNSHADYEAIDRECFGCNSGDLFDDCPKGCTSDDLFDEEVANV